jgi:DNA-binding winged helix-turn-helix (wHTH) protein
VIWSFGGFELDDERFVLRRGDEVVELRRKVFDVLRYLLAHTDRVVSKDELLRNVWPGETIQEAVIAQNIAILRKVLGDSRRSAEMIQTVHGRGYRFVAEVELREGETSGRPVSLSPGRMPLFGRQAVMSELRQCLRSAIAGRGRLVALIGEAGIGKTRTAEELSSEARALNVRVLEGRCHEGEGSPAYWPFVQIMRAAVGDRSLATARGNDRGPDAAMLLAALRGGTDRARSGSLDTAEARFRLFDDVTSWLAQASRAQPLLLVFDDLHWADEATLHLLRFLSHEVRTLPLLVLVTTREIDARVEPSLAALLTTLTSSTQTLRLPLTGLSEEATSELVSATLQRDPGSALLRDLHSLTEGNPFFLHELLQLFGRGDAGGQEAVRVELPKRVREVTGLRLRSLSAEAQRVLSLASVIGRDFHVAVLEHATGLPRADLLAALEGAARARIVRETRDPEHAESGRYSFAHALIRESLYGALTEPERVQLHDRIGRALEAQYGVDTDTHLDELAYHASRAAAGGDVDRAVSYCERAAERASGMLAFELAATHYERALQALSCRLPVDENRRFELKLALGSALFRAGRDGNPALLGAAELARREGRGDRLAQVALAMLGWPRVVLRGRTQNAELRPLLEEALAAKPAVEATLRARLLSALALNGPETASLAEQAEQSAEALEFARALGRDDALYDALLARVRLLLGPDALAERLALADELLATAHRLGQKERVFMAQHMRTQPLLAFGDVVRADEAIGACDALARELRLPGCTLIVLRLRLERAYGDGRFEELRELTREAVRVRGQWEVSAGTAVTLYLWRTFARVDQGDHAWFDRNIEELAKLGAMSQLFQAHVAHVYATFGKPQQARSRYRPLLAPERLDERRDDDWLMALALITEAVVLCDDREAARTIYERLSPYEALNVTAFEWLAYLGSCGYYLGLLAALAGELDAARAHFEKAIEANTKLGARAALARTELAYAKALLATKGKGGERGPDLTRARALVRSATALAQELGLQPVLREARALAGE